MSSDHLHRPPTATGEPSASTVTNSLPHTPPPMKPTNLNSLEPNSTPGSRLAAALGRVIFNIPPIPVQDSAPITNTLLRTLSDADSSANQTTTTITPPKITRNNPLRRSLSDEIDYQPPRKTPKVSTGKKSPQSERLRKLEDMVREIEHRCREIVREEEQVEVDNNAPQPQSQEGDECVGVERLKNGDLRFELSCSCGKKFEMLIKHNGYCFYRLT